MPNSDSEGQVFYPTLTLMIDFRAAVVIHFIEESPILESLPYPNFKV